jgi:hypothetical protein
MVGNPASCTDVRQEAASDIDTGFGCSDRFLWFFSLLGGFWDSTFNEVTAAAFFIFFDYVIY